MKPTPEQERIARAVVKISYLEAESEHGSVVSELYIKIAQALADEAERARMEERERCARVAENGDNFAEQGHPLLVVVAAAIRQME